MPSTTAAQLALLTNDDEYAAQCESMSGNLLPFVGTVDAARDLDRIRQAIGDAQLTYFGHSYGTLLGAIYAQMFPTHVRAMVLDGAIDPAMSTAADGRRTEPGIRVGARRLLRVVHVVGVPVATGRRRLSDDIC